MADSRGSDPLVNALPAVYFDGSSGAAHAVVLRIRGPDLMIDGEGVQRAVPARSVQWPERTRQAIRLAHLSAGGSVQSDDAAAWDAWCDANGLGAGLVARMQGSWRWVLVSLMLLVAIAGAMQQWGIPMLARAVVSVTPRDVDAAIGRSALIALDAQVLQPSELPSEQQARLRAGFAVVAAAQPAGSVPAWQLVFRKSLIGPNALALPDGTLVMTDELVALVGGDADVIMGVLAHELGHVRRRHGLHSLVQTTVLAGVAAIVLGDFSFLLAGAPVLLGRASYSRDFEREADREAVAILTAANISPAVMVRLFDRLAGLRGRGRTGTERGIGIAFDSHPVDSERIRFFTEAARP